MASKRTKCIKRVGGIFICKICEGRLIKHGLSSAGEQRFQCKVCKKTQIESYKNRACLRTANQEIINHLKEGC